MYTYLAFHFACNSCGIVLITELLETSLLVDPRRLFCFGSLLILDVAFCY